MANWFGTVLQILGFVYVFIGWYQAVFLAYPTVYPNQFDDYPFRVWFEHIIGYWLAFSVTYNYAWAFMINPHGQDPK